MFEDIIGKGKDKVNTPKYSGDDYKHLGTPNEIEHAFEIFLKITEHPLYKIIIKEYKENIRKINKKYGIVYN